MDGTSYREQLYEIFAGRADPLGEKIQRGLDLGTEYLDLPIGYSTRIVDGTQRIDHAVGDHSLIQPGRSCPLEEAYCRQAIESDNSLAVQDAHASTEIAESAVQRFDLGTYIGAKVTVDDDPYGTICFADRAERAAGFDEAETYFVELFARLTGQAMERRNYERKLERRRTELHERNQLIGVLNRVLRHNLRNDMNVIISNAEALRDRLDGEDAALLDQIMDTGRDLMHISETARRLETTLNDFAEAAPQNVVPYVRQPAGEVDEAYPNASIQVHAPEQAVAKGTENLELAIQELIENAATHAGESPSVTVRVTEAEDSVTVRVQDDGPGLPTQEREVLLSGEETSLVHGSGLGLWLVHWIVKSIDGTLRVENCETGACIEIELEKET